MLNLVTGGSGFIGRHLVTSLRARAPQETVLTMDRRREGGAEHHCCDLTDPEALESAISKLKPDRIYHLAGMSKVSDVVSEHFESNFLTSVPILEAAGRLGKPVSFFLASSVHIYGNQSGMISENADPHPISAYGFCKFLTEEAAKEAAKKYPSLKIVVGRLYNCIGPGQGSGFVVSDFAERIVSVLGQASPALKTGSLKSVRQFIDVRDLVVLLPSLLDAALPSSFEVVNIASSRSLKIADVLEMLLNVSGKKVQVESKDSVAPNPFLGLTLSTQRLESLVHPRLRSLEETVRDIFEEKRAHART